MKQVKLRSMLVLALIAVLGAGVALFCVQYVGAGRTVGRLLRQ